MTKHSSDVLVIGGGNAGMCAAITARMAGASVTVLDAANRGMRGGNTRHTRNLRVAHDAPLATLQDSYSVDTYWQDLLRVTAGNTNEKLAKLTIERSADLLVWLQSVGVRFQPALTGTLNLAHSNAFFLGGGKSLLNAQYLTAESLGIEVHYNCEIDALVLEGARFLEAVDSTGDVWVANSLVVASGGFQSNEAWMREVWGDRADNFLIRGTPHNQGKVLANLISQGVATVGEPTQCHAVAIDARAPKYDGGIVSRLDCVCFSIVVNQKAQRFYDEGEDFWPKRYAIWGRLVADQDEQTAYAVVDAKVAENYMPSVYPPIEAQSIEQLAVKLGLDAHALHHTVSQFNAAVQPGRYDPKILDDCHTRGLSIPKSNWALPIDSAPYYAYPLKPGITFTYLGLRVNEHAQVGFASDDDSQVWSENIYAAGEVMAGNILGQGYCAGIGMTIGGVFGRIAGAQAACQ